MNSTIDLDKLFASDIIQLIKNNHVSPIDFENYEPYNFIINRENLDSYYGRLDDKSSWMLEESIKENIKFECNPESVNTSPPPAYIKKPDGDDTPQWIWDHYKNGGRTS
jgi:hypothetical protein